MALDSSSPSGALTARIRTVPGARVAWRQAWGAYCAVRDGARQARRFAGEVQRGVRLATDPVYARPYAAGGESKPTVQRVADNVAWAFQHGKANPFYYAFGMDKEGGSSESYMSVPQMMTVIDEQIRQDRSSYPTAILKDKYFFALVAQSLGHPSPRVHAVLTPAGVELLAPRRPLSFEDFVAQSPPIDGFAKAVGGEKGRGAFALRIEEGQAWVDGEPAEPGAIADRVGGRFLFQERIVQHPALNALHAASVNTLRLVTVLRDGRAEPLAAALRVGVGGCPVDNWSAGGLVVGLDLTSGALFGKGLFKPGYGGDRGHGGVADRHPDSGIVFEGYTLPFIPESVQLAQQFHLDMGGPRSIGWDLALTPEGPSVVEGNSHWSGAMYMAIDPVFKSRYVEMAGIRE
ncbi:sugar-transfer associated ATP-grasp domain-containing protein [Rubrivirga sp.]|uniref:sugar-transfer associated ATP-grasp domain-containing protein n=1 Tax=Rubrivirga sp. TaxID=1885344 RepID=UPI003B51E344